MNKEQVKGRIEEAKGTVKEIAGKVSGKDSLKLEGKLQREAGRAQAGFSDIKNDINKGE